MNAFEIAVVLVWSSTIALIVVTAASVFVRRGLAPFRRFGWALLPFVLTALITMLSMKVNSEESLYKDAILAILLGQLLISPWLLYRSRGIRVVAAAVILFAGWVSILAALPGLLYGL